MQNYWRHIIWHEQIKIVRWATLTWDIKINEMWKAHIWTNANAPIPCPFSEHTVRHSLTYYTELPSA
jgi:hypothetical protein